MADPRFPVLGSTVAPLLGRTKVMQRLWSDLTKPTPSNLSIVGPRYVGKSVIMHALAGRVRKETCPFQAVLHWHLGHVAPVSDEDFVSQLCEQLRESLGDSSASGFGEHREYLKGHSFGCLKEVTDLLDAEHNAVLMLWDGFDKPLGQDKLSRHLWDQMRTIFYGKRHKIVTATRKPLSELIRSQDAITSPFWNIFDNPIRVGPFDDADRDAILAELGQIAFLPGATSELVNWTAGCPPLFLAVLNQIVAAMPGGTADNETVNAAAAGARDSVAGILSDLWEDCTQPAKDLYRHLVEHGELLTSDVGRAERTQLAEKGFVAQSGNKIVKACRLLEHYVASLGPDAGSMVRLFGQWPDYRGNIRGLLELRLAHLTSVDGRLRRLIEMCIENVPDYPDLCLTNVRNISDHALDLIWHAEFGSSRKIPSDLFAYWEKTLPEQRAMRLRDQFPDEKVPAGNRGYQCQLLQLLVGAAPRLERRAKRVSKSTYVLVNSVHTFGDLGQHLEGRDVHQGAAIAAVMSCLELAACLDRELG